MHVYSLIGAWFVFVVRVIRSNVMYAYVRRSDVSRHEVFVNCVHAHEETHRNTVDIDEELGFLFNAEHKIAHIRCFFQKHLPNGKKRFTEFIFRLSTSMV